MGAQDIEQKGNVHNVEGLPLRNGNAGFRRSAAFSILCNNHHALRRVPLVAQCMSSRLGVYVLSARYLNGAGRPTAFMSMHTPSLAVSRSVANSRFTLSSTVSAFYAGSDMRFWQ